MGKIPKDTRSGIGAFDRKRNSNRWNAQSLNRRSLSLSVCSGGARSEPEKKSEAHAPAGADWACDGAFFSQRIIDSRPSIIARRRIPGDT